MLSAWTPPVGRAMCAIRHLVATHLSVLEALGMEPEMESALVSEALDWFEVNRTPPASPDKAEAMGFVWSSSFGNPGSNGFSCAYRHPDGRRAWYRWATPTDRCTASWEAR